MSEELNGANELQWGQSPVISAAEDGDECSPAVLTGKEEINADFHGLQW